MLGWAPMPSSRFPAGRIRLDAVLLPVLLLPLGSVMPAEATLAGPVGSGDAVHHPPASLTGTAPGSATLNPGSRQDITGQVVEQIWALPVAGAEVVLMDAGAEEYLELAATETDDSGLFTFRDVEPGIYLVQARRGGSFSELSPEIEVEEGGSLEPVILAFPSPAVQEVSRCLGDDAEEAGSVLLGVLFHADAEVALPETRLVLRETASRADAGAEGWSAEVEADEGGRFLVCDVPPEVELTGWGYALGEVSRPVEGIVVEEASLVRMDLPLEFQGGAAMLETRIEVQAVGDTGVEGDPVTVLGRLLDAVSGEPIRGAIVRVPEQGREALSGPDGSFRLEDLDPGALTLEVDHLGYGTQRTPLELADGVDAELDFRLSPRALVLDGMEVTARRGELERRTPFTRPSHVIAGERLQQLEEFGSNVVTAVRELGGGLRVRDERREGACIESSRRILSWRPDDSRPAEACQMVTVVLDGTVLHEGQNALFMLSLRDIESIEYLPPADAGIRYGIDASTVGALEIWTRGRGPYRSSERNR